MKAGWETKRLDQLFRIGSSKRVLQSEWQSSGVPFYRGREITQLAINGRVKNDLFITEKHYSELKNQYGVPSSGDIMITAIGTIGNAHIVREVDRFYFKDASVLWMKKTSDVNSKYIDSWLKSDMFFDQLDRGNGATVDTLTIQKLQSVTLCFPPLPEQQRIVGILDEAFAAIASAKAKAEQNLNNARALFESHLNEVFSDHWKVSKIVSLADLASDITDGDHLPPPKSPTGVPFITIGNIVKETHEIDFSDTFMVPQAYFNALKPNKRPRLGDVLYTVTGSFGIPVIVRDNAKFCFQRHIGLIRPKIDTNSTWLYYLILSPQLLKQANEGATGTAQKTVSLKLLRSFKVPMVDPLMQAHSVEKLDALLSQTRRLESLYQRKIEELDALKKSLLEQAFKGEL